MLNRVRSSFHLALAFRSYRLNDIKSSVYHVEKSMSLSNKMTATALSFRATLFLLDNDLANAASYFSEAARIVHGDMNKDPTYIRLYCEYYICMINEGHSCDDIRTKALTTPASDRIKTWLPLPDKSVPI